MTTFIILSKLSLHRPGEIKSLSEIDKELNQRIEEEYPKVRRVASYVLLGEFDFLHIFESPDATVTARISLLLHSLGMGSTQTLTAIPFNEFHNVMEE
ncbi:MAG TPA: GYD domain-containing protein [Thermoflexia bacterium]|nr:GYD domain-containing protein [Thermoflexia bacterium]